MISLMCVQQRGKLDAHDLEDNNNECRSLVLWVLDTYIPP